MKITERDIFNFVFYPYLVREEIKLFLTSIEGSSEEIKFYRELKISLDDTITLDIKRKIAKKIEAYKFINSVILYPMHTPLKEIKHDFLVLAAASENNIIPKIVTKTFVDDGKDYLIKLLSYGNTTKVFVFSTHDEVLKDFHLVIEPQNLRFHIKDNTEPFKINKRIEAENIRIEF